MTASSSIDMLQRLVAFDTTSRNSNLDLIKFIQGYLTEHDVPSTLMGVTVLGYDDQLVEIEAVAAVID